MSTIERLRGNVEPPPSLIRSRLVTEFVKAWLEARVAAYSCFAASLERVIDLPVEQVDPADLDAFFVLKHLGFLLKQGEPLCSTCDFRWSSHLQGLLEISHYRRYEQSIQKVSAIISDAPLDVDGRAFHQANRGPSIQIRLHTVTVDLEGGEIGVSIPDVSLTTEELLDILRHKHASRARQESLGEVNGEARRVAIADDRALIRQALTHCRGSIAGDADGERRSHPYRGPQLLLLPRLLRDRNGATPLRVISDSLESIKACGFDGVMLSPVDVQSVHTYFDETDDGRFVAHVNNHGYWPSGVIGIDPSIGTQDEYRVLVARASELGMCFTQDCTFGTLGYMPQLPRLASDASQPLDRLYLGGKATDGCDVLSFIHEIGLQEEAAFDGELSAPHYEDLVALVHRGSLYRLPRPDLFQDDIRAAVMDRALWLVAHAGVQSFRIDMAKHMGVRQLRTIIADLRAAVGAAGKDACAFSAVLEYWTTHYRDLRFGMESLGDEATGAYFLDFPLASAIYSSLIGQADLGGTLQRLQSERARYGMDIRRLVPTFIDHDGVFRPIYNGTAETTALTVAGFVMAFMLSANGPHAYFQFADARCGVADLSRFGEYREKHSRRQVSAVLEDVDPLSPREPVARFFDAFRRGRFIEDWDGGDITVDGDADHVVISRRFREHLSGQSRALVAVIRRAADVATASGDSGLVFEHCGSISTQIFVGDSLQLRHERGWLDRPASSGR